MEISEKERLMLVKKKEEILELTKNTMDLLRDPAEALQVKKNITSILSKVGIIASYAEPRDKKALELLELKAKQIFHLMDLLGNKWTVAKPYIEEFCNEANSIQFNFKKKGRKIEIRDIHFHLPKIP